MIALGSADGLRVRAYTEREGRRRQRTYKSTRESEEQVERSRAFCGRFKLNMAMNGHNAHVRA